MFWIDPTDDTQNGGTRAFTADYESDIAKLPTSTTLGTGGENNIANQKVAKNSSCFCLENSAIYFLNSQDIWVEQ